MEKIIFFGLIIPILIFVIYLAGRAIRTGFNAKNSNQSDLEIDSKDNQENLISEIVGILIFVSGVMLLLLTKMN